MQKSSQPNIGNAVKGDFHPLLPPHRGRTVRVAVEDLAKSQCAEHSVALWAHEGSGADIRAIRADSKSEYRNWGWIARNGKTYAKRKMNWLARMVSGSSRVSFPHRQRPAGNDRW